MTLNFKYKLLHHSDGSISKVPLVPITLVGKEIITAYGLVDSGSDTCAISQNMAELLGIHLAGKREKSFGIGGAVESVLSGVTIFLRQGREKYKLHVPVRVILKPHDFPVILGQESFFDQFIISFDRKNEHFSLKRHGVFFPL